MSGGPFDPAERPPALTRWEWRVFAPSLEEAARPHLAGGDPLAPGEDRVDRYLLAPGLSPELGLKLRGGALLELKRLEERRGELERWTKAFYEPLPVLPYGTRILTRLLQAPGPVPVRPLRSPDEVLRYLRDVRLGEPRAVALTKQTRSALLPGPLRLEWTRLGLADGSSVESLALDASDPDVLLALRARLTLPPGARVASYPTWLADSGA